MGEQFIFMLVVAEYVRLGRFGSVGDDPAAFAEVCVAENAGSGEAIALVWRKGVLPSAHSVLSRVVLLVGEHIVSLAEVSFVQVGSL